MRLPHPIVLLSGGVLVAAALTWLLPAGEYDKRDDPSTGRRVAVAGTYHRTEPAPVGPFAAIVAIPRGIVAAAEVIAVVLFVGGAWVVVDRLGTLPAIVGALIGAFGGRRLWIIPIISVFFAVMGALENMQEEIIPLVPALLVLGAGIGIDAVAVVAMSVGAAMVGSAFGPTNPFQAGIALKLAQEPPLAAGGLRLAMFVVGVTLWIVWTMRYVAAGGHRPVAETLPRAAIDASPDRRLGRHLLIISLVIVPMAAYVYGALKLDWGFNELSAAFLLGGVAAGIVGGMSVAGLVTNYLDGMLVVLPAAIMVGVARSISLVLQDGRVVDTILYGLVTAIGRAPAVATGGVMILFQGLVHIAVPSVSGQAVLTMPLFVPAADVLGFSREVPVLAYQTGAGLMEFLTPTNGGLMAVLVAAGVPFGRWLRFSIGGVLLLVLVGLAAITWVR